MNTEWVLIIWLWASSYSQLEKVEGFRSADQCELQGKAWVAARIPYNHRPGYFCIAVK